MRSPAPVLVVTGPTGSGKSTLCSWLAEQGAWWIDADAVGHELLEEPALRGRLVERFGVGVLDGNGEIDRQALGRLVFADEGQLAQLNALVHPPLVAELRRRIEVLRSGRTTELIVVDAALHFQMEPTLEADLVVGVTAPADLREQRVAQRDGLTPEAARERMARQAAVEASLPRADAVLDSDTLPEELRRQFYALLDERLGTGFAERAVRLRGGSTGSHDGEPASGESS